MPAPDELVTMVHAAHGSEQRQVVMPVADEPTIIEVLIAPKTIKTVAVTMGDEPLTDVVAITAEIADDQ